MKLFPLLIISLFLLTCVSAQTETLGIFEKDSCIQLKQTCADCTYVNFSRVSYPDSTLALGQVTSEKVGSIFNYTFCNTTQLGTYVLEGIGDVEGTDTVFSYDFDVTLNGNPPGDGVVVVVYTIMFILFIAFGITYFIISLGHTIQLEMDLIDLTIMVSTYLAMWVFYYVSFEYLGNPIINEILEIAISVGAVTHVFLPFVAFLLSFIMTNLKFKQKARITY